ncbi:MAG: hypothetical protein IJT94_05975 [Oscillibacter sp.]|nr:hypothetical protein [Oscillibacter sp.]
MRMRTIDQAHADLLAADPGCALAKSALRRLVVTGRVPSVRVGSKYLIDIDRLPELLFTTTATAAAEQPETVHGIRRLEARL